MDPKCSATEKYEKVRKAVSSNELIQFLAADIIILTYIMYVYNAIYAVYAVYNVYL